MENFYTYIIYSKVFDKYYKGFSTNPKQRLVQHNLGESKYTSNFRPWELVHIETFTTKKEALIREKKLKKYSKAQIIELSNSHLNKINELG
ncbi:MAG: GIY-YIG nuclease family protein [Flavobacteriia bacterium]|nr:GIY-YIG nuclease family protein [Flavobacteriia bacterium]